MATQLQPFGDLASCVEVRILASTAMQDELLPDLSAQIDELTPRLEALGLSDIAARLRALSAQPEAPRLSGLFEQQLLSILDQTEQL
jgi:hypothetical protein